MASCATTTVEFEAIELQARPVPAKVGPRQSHQIQDAPQTSDRPDRLSNLSGSRILAEAGGVEPDETPRDRVESTQKWNEPTINKFRVGAAFWSLLVMGANDAAYGALIPSLEKYYDLTYTVVSMVFISPFVGYVLSAFINNWLHLKIGQRGIAMLCGGSHLVAYIAIAAHPPYIALIIAFMFAGFGNGLGDAAWNAWMGNLANASELLGFMHACYGVGGVFSPLVSTAMITKANMPWYNFYYIMIGFSAIELLVLTWAFWKADGASYRGVYRDNEIERETGLTAAIFRMPAARTSWICAFFLLCYVGVEVALGGWIVVFMTNVRGGEPFASGMTATGFWLGITVGRAVLGFVTPRIGVKTAIACYIAATMGLELLFWLVPQFYVSAVAVAFQGFFLGPLFPGVVLIASKLLPRHQHVIVIGFAAALGGCGAAILPFAVGVLAQVSGVQVLQPIILSLLGVLLFLWLSLPRINKRRE
ncbi:Fc.00g033100.m01.CDS01 [Cosmosporella sp. VM-42]